MEPEQFVRLDSDNPVRGVMEIYSTKDDDAYISRGQIRGQRIAIRPLRYSDAMNTIFCHAT
jgi:hypothetical protein